MAAERQGHFRDFSRALRGVASTVTQWDHVFMQVDDAQIRVTVIGLLVVMHTEFFRQAG